MDRKTIRDMEYEKERCKDDAKRQRKQLELDPSFDASYWTARQQIAEKEIQATLLSKQISIANMNDKTKDNNTKDFLESEAGQRLILLERSLTLDSKIYGAQAEKTRSKAEKFNFRRPYLQVSTMGAESGLSSIKHSRRQRDKSLQSAFRSDLILQMGSDHPELDRPDDLWCPVTHMYWPMEATVAGHLFPWTCGEDTMDAIFGRPDSGHSELFKAENGILWSTGAEQRFEGGHFVIVPDIPNQPTKQQIDAWEASDPKEYKVRVLNPTHTLIRAKFLGTDITWADLDNRRLQFKTTFRPRARYLYFTYCAAMLRRSLMGKHLEASSADIWGVPGRYMPKRMLMGFVEHMGREYEFLLKGAIEDDDGVVTGTMAIAAANAHN